MTKKVKVFAGLLILVGSLSWSLTMVKSGLTYSYGMGFWGPNGHDGVWHIALIESLSRFDFSLPIMAGEVLQNYHFGFDLVLAMVHRLTAIPPVTLYFQIVPPILAATIGLLTYQLVFIIAKSKTQAWWSTFFVYFGGSFGWLVGLLKDGRFGGESMFWANQAISTLINPPYALSLMVLLTGLILLTNYLQKPTRKMALIVALVFGSLFVVKIYAAIIIALGLILLWITTLLLRRSRVEPITRLLLLTAITGIMFFFPFNQLSGSLLVLSPFWFSHTMLAFGDRLGWFKLEQARITYQQSGLWVKWLLAEGLAIGIFILGNVGARVIGLLAIKSLWRNDVGRLIILCLLPSLLIPLLFIQRGNPWNTIQFFYYTQFFLALFAGIAIGRFLESRKIIKVVKLTVLIIVIVLTLPTTWISLKDIYLPSRPPARISMEELEALTVLKHQPLGVVLSYPFNPEWRSAFIEPKPLYAYETTAYISAFSGQPSFLADEMNLTITGYQFEKRRSDSAKFFTTTESDWARQFVKEYKVKYVYLVKGQKFNLSISNIGGIKSFENGEVVLYQIE